MQSAGVRQMMHEKEIERAIAVLAFRNLLNMIDFGDYLNSHGAIAQHDFLHFDLMEREMAACTAHSSGEIVCRTAREVTTSENCRVDGACRMQESLNVH